MMDGMSDSKRQLMGDVTLGTCGPIEAHLCDAFGQHIAQLREDQARGQV